MGDDQGPTDHEIYRRMMEINQENLLLLKWEMLVMNVCSESQVKDVFITAYIWDRI